MAEHARLGALVSYLESATGRRFGDRRQPLFRFGALGGGALTPQWRPHSKAALALQPFRQVVRDVGRAVCRLFPHDSQGNRISG